MSQKDGLTSKDCKNILANNFVVLIGDSVIRGIYKDLISFLQKSALMENYDLKNKGEHSFKGDEKIEGSVMTNGKNYREVRQYKTDYHLIRFYFITRVYNSYVEEILTELYLQDPSPDIFIASSCLWDITRYGYDSLNSYSKNVKKLISLMHRVLPTSCHKLWLSSMPISDKVQGGFIIEAIAFVTQALRLDQLIANHQAASIVREKNMAVIDLHFHFRQSILTDQTTDGIHWSPIVHRQMSNLILHKIMQLYNCSI